MQNPSTSNKRKSKISSRPSPNVVTTEELQNIFIKNPTFQDFDELNENDSDELDEVDSDIFDDINSDEFDEIDSDEYDENESEVDADYLQVNGNELSVGVTLTSGDVNSEGLNNTKGKNRSPSRCIQTQRSCTAAITETRPAKRARLETIIGFSDNELNETSSVMTVSKLQQLNFSKLSLDEKVDIKGRGRPTPNVQIFQTGISNRKRYVRSFHSEWYQRKSWLCGCEVRNALFCFPCLLCGGEVTWTKDGFTNINKMKEKTEAHEKSKKHIENVVSLSLLGRVKEKLSEAHRLSINEHNRKVTQNREILSKIIDCIIFCGSFGIPLRGHDEMYDSVPSVFRGLINFASKLDPDLKNHVETSRIFKGVPKTMQTELLDCLLQIYRDEIKKEIIEASFVAIMVDDIADVSEHTQLVFVLRYVLNQEIFERFWGFFNPENQTADGISKCILEQLDIILQGNRQKLIAQTYGGANVRKGEGSVQAKIKTVYSNAHYIRCYRHTVKRIFRNAASVTQGSKIFFSNIWAIPAFFSRAPRRVTIINKPLNASNPHPSSETRVIRIDKTRIVTTVHEYLEPLKSCLVEIQSTSNVDETVSEATGILHNLNDETFIFWLELFNEIMPHIEVLYSHLSRKIVWFKVHEYITNFKTAILEIRNSKCCENPSKMLMDEAKKVCDGLCVDLGERCSFTNHLVAAKLLKKRLFACFKDKLPTEKIRLTTEAYPMINKEKLTTELKVFYGRSDMHEHGRLTDILTFILENNLDGVLSEITKLIKILLTIPMFTSERGRWFFTLKRIKNFLKSTVKQEGLSALGLISTETNFFNNHPNIKEKVIDLFAQNETRRMDFSFK